MLSSLTVAVVLGIIYLAYDIALDRGVAIVGGDLRVLFVAVDVLVVLVVGSFATWLLVPQPAGSSGRRARSGWSAALGFFAAVPIAYLTLVVIVQVVRPLVAR